MLQLKATACMDVCPKQKVYIEFTSVRMLQRTIAIAIDGIIIARAARLRFVHAAASKKPEMENGTAPGIHA